MPDAEDVPFVVLAVGAAVGAGVEDTTVPGEVCAAVGTVILYPPAFPLVLTSDIAVTRALSIALFEVVRMVPVNVGLMVITNVTLTLVETATELVSKVTPVIRARLTPVPVVIPFAKAYPMSMTLFVAELLSVY